MLDTFSRARLKKQLQQEEGYRQFPYTDTEGNLTVGIGRNLTSRGVFEIEAQGMLDNDISYFQDKLHSALPFFDNLDQVRKAVLIDMCFNMGTNKFMAFERFLHLVSLGNYKAAANEMMLSRWAVQVGQRANTLSKMMEVGKWTSI